MTVATAKAIARGAAVVELEGQVVSLIYQEPGIYNRHYVYESAGVAQDVFNKLVEGDRMFLLHKGLAVNISRADVIEVRDDEVAFIFSNGITRYVKCANAAAAQKFFADLMEVQETYVPGSAS